ncbi:MAG: cell division protein SepF [Candidatus Pacearchaeota archaeon]|nr:cell division protein SepF [Candidatus Pacearchaeota archaeon]
MSFLKKLFGAKEPASEAEYIEIETGREPKKSKIIIRPFVLKTFEDTNKILETLREGYNIAIIDIKPLKSKDVVELKRAIAKLKKTVDALEGSIAGFGENIIVAAPSFVEIYKGEAKTQKE